MDRPIIVVGLLSLLTHQLFRRYDTLSITTHTLLTFLPVCIGLELFRATMPLFHAACASIAVFLPGLLISILIYRLSPFHPLARYPGPFACKVSKFWMAYIGYTGYQHPYIKSLHERYGDFVRIGPNELSIRDPSLLNDILGSPGLPKGPLMIGRTLSAVNPPLVGITNPTIHHERRKPWNRAFSAIALKEYKPLLANRAAQLVHVLEELPQKGNVYIERFFNYFAYDLMCDMAFGGGSELLRDGDKNDIWSTIEEGWELATFLSHVPWFAIYISYIPFVSAPVNRLISYSQDCVVQRLRRGPVRKDLFHYLSNEDMPDRAQPAVQQIIDDGIVAIVAGADTTSSALTSLIFCITTHPDTYKQLQAEVDQFYPAGEDACDPKHHRDMHYLTAVINETLRLYPPVPSGGQRRVPHDSQGATLGPRFVAAGTAMFLHPYSLHRDPRNFSPHPDRFWPGRWLVAAGRQPAPRDAAAPFAHNDAAFVPFSHGPANCVGRQFAMQEMRTVVCAVLQRLDVRVRAGWDPHVYDAGFRDFFVTKRPRPPVTVHSRS